MTRAFFAMATAAACLFAAAPSLAATPIVVGQAQGGTPDIAVDSAGRAHIVWDDTSPPATSADVVSYCRLARGASACGVGAIFAGSPFGIFGRPHVFSYAPDQVSVFYQRCCGGTEGTREVYSPNGGANFGTDTRISDTVTYNASEAAINPSGGPSFSLLSELSTQAIVQNADISGVETAEALLGSAGTNQGAIAIQQPSGRPVVVYQNQTTPNWSFVWRKLIDTVPATEANINNAANWAVEAPVDNDRVTAASGPALAAGPNGIYVFYQKRAPDEGFIRAFSGTGWTAPVKIVEGQSFNDLDLFQDDGGRLHAVWSAYNDGALRYRWSDDGVNWSPTVDIARGDFGYPQVRVSAASDHQGFAVWNRGGPDVVAVALEALPPLPPSGGGPGGGDHPLAWTCSRPLWVTSASTVTRCSPGRARASASTRAKPGSPPSPFAGRSPDSGSAGPGVRSACRAPAAWCAASAARRPRRVPSGERCAAVAARRARPSAGSARRWWQGRTRSRSTAAWPGAPCGRVATSRSCRSETRRATCRVSRRCASAWRGREGAEPQRCR